MKKKYLIIIVLLTIAGTILFIGTPDSPFFIGNAWPRGELLSTKTYSSDGISIKMDAYEQLVLGVPNMGGLYYVFEFRSDESSDWQQLFQVPMDNPIENDEYGIRIINDDVAYFYIYYCYEVTINHGKTWERWTPKENKYKSHISDVNMSTNGEGTLYLSSYGETTEYTTVDYGVHWRKEISPEK